MKKIIFLLVFSLVLLGIITFIQMSSYTEKDSTNGSTYVEAWFFNSTDESREAIEILTDKFNTQQSEYHVELQFYPYGDIWIKSTATIAAGNPPDVIINNGWTLNYRASLQQVEDLTNYIPEYEQFNINNYDEDIQAAIQYEGKIYGIPFAFSPQIIYYNKEMFANNDIDEIPETFEEFKNAIYSCEEKNSEGEWSTIGFNMMYGYGDLEPWLISANNGEHQFFNDDENFSFYTEENIAVFEAQMELENHYGIDFLNEKLRTYDMEVKDPMINEEACMVQNNVSYSFKLDSSSLSSNYGVFPIPTLNKGDIHYSSGDFYTLEVPTGSDNIEGAVEYIMFLIEPENQKYFSEHAYVLSPSNLVAQDMIEHSSNTSLVTAYISSEIIINYDYAPLDKYDYASYWIPIQESILAGNLSPSEGLKQAQDTIPEKYY